MTLQALDHKKTYSWELPSLPRICKTLFLFTAALCLRKNELDPPEQLTERATSPPPTLCSYRKTQSAALQSWVNQALENGGQLVWIESSSGVYAVKNKEDATIAIFKPSDERNGGPNNRDPSLRGKELSPDEMNRRHFIPGFPAERQQLAGSLDFGFSSCFPVGTIVTLKSDAFVGGTSEKTGYLQEYIAWTTPLVEFHPKRSLDFEDNPILDEVPLNEFQEILLKDILFHNEDRHPGNIQVRRDSQGKPHLIPIDMDMILPWELTNPYKGLFTHSRAKEPLSPSTLHLIQQLNPDHIESTVTKLNLPKQAAINAKALAIVLQKLSAEGFSLQAIQQFITQSSRLSKILDSLSTHSEKQFWPKFEQLLEKQIVILKAKETRTITFGTTYLSGNPDRDSLSQLVSDNQQNYAKIWELDGRVVTDNLLVNECEGIDCVPYWNKVAVLRNWLLKPTAPENEGKEEWYIIADDDMPVTNVGINPYELIDLLRQGKDTSIIIVQDAQLWRNADEELSVNTGLMMFRKDPASLRFIEKLWNKRNSPSNVQDPDCPTLGTCKNQAVLHEQEAFARLIEENRSLLSSLITIVKPRAKYQGKELALNTFKREGSFLRIQKYWDNRCISFNDPIEGQWKKGDFMGQTAGVPIVGMFCYDTDQKKISIREKYLKEMIAQLVDEAPTYAASDKTMEAEDSYYKKPLNDLRLIIDRNTGELLFAGLLLVMIAQIYAAHKYRKPHTAIAELSNKAYNYMTHSPDKAPLSYKLITRSFLSTIIRSSLSVMAIELQLTCLNTTVRIINHAALVTALAGIELTADAIKTMYPLIENALSSYLSKKSSTLLASPTKNAPKTATEPLNSQQEYTALPISEPYHLSGDVLNILNKEISAIVIKATQDLRLELEAEKKRSQDLTIKVETLEKELLEGRIAATQTENSWSYSI